MTKLKYFKNKLVTLEDVINLSKEVFKPTQKEIDIYHDKNDWKEKIFNDGLLISVYYEEDCVAFIISYKKSKNRLHMWNAGVHRNYRKQGIWSKMYEKTIEFANRNKYREVSLNTYEEKFPVMFKFAKSNEFEIYKTGMVNDPAVGKVEKSYFRKKLGKDL